MPDRRFVAPRVALEAAGEATSAVVLELSGHHAAVRSPRRLPKHAPVCVRLDWADGAFTSLPGTVISVDGSGVDLVTRVDLTGIEDDWSRFLAYVGTSLPAT